MNFDPARKKNNSVSMMVLQGGQNLRGPHWGEIGQPFPSAKKYFFDRKFYQNIGGNTVKLFWILKKFFENFFWTKLKENCQNCP